MTEIVEGEVVDHTPAPSQREPRPISTFVAGGELLPMVPQTPEEYARLATLLIDAGCVPASYESKKPGQDGFRETRAKLIIGLMKSVEIGVPPITGLNGIMIVNNRPSVWGDLAVSLIQRAGHLEHMEVHKFGPEPTRMLELPHWDENFGFRVLMWRIGQSSPYVGEFSVGDAKRAGLWMNTSKKPWVYYPLDMLFNRARAKAMRAGFADDLHGMSIVEEARDIVHEIKAVSASPVDDDEPVTSLPAPETQIMQDFGPGAEQPELHPVPVEESEKAETPAGQGDLLS